MNNKIRIRTIDGLDFVIRFINECYPDVDYHIDYEVQNVVNPHTFRTEQIYETYVTLDLDEESRDVFMLRLQYDTLQEHFNAYSTEKKLTFGLK